jgi:hypothetical protein
VRKYYHLDDTRKNIKDERHSNSSNSNNNNNNNADACGGLLLPNAVDFVTKQTTDVRLYDLTAVFERPGFHLRIRKPPIIVTFFIEDIRCV